MLADVEALVRDDMQALSDARVAAHIFSLLVVPPRRLQLGWTFGTVGETLNGFLALEHARSGAGIVYCAQGYGPERPWGLLATNCGSLYTGTADHWYPRFLDAYFESRASADVAIWRVREWRLTRDGAWVSGEFPWDEAWEQVAALRASAPDAQYYCDHSVRY